MVFETTIINFVFHQDISIGPCQRVILLHVGNTLKKPVLRAMNAMRKVRYQKRQLKMFNELRQVLPIPENKTKV